MLNKSKEAWKTNVVENEGADNRGWLSGYFCGCHAVVLAAIEIMHKHEG